MPLASAGSSPNKSPSKPLPSGRPKATPTVTSRTSRATAGTSTSSSSLRPQNSTTSLRPKVSTSGLRSPAGTASPLRPQGSKASLKSIRSNASTSTAEETSAPPSPSKPTMSIREAIALKRAEAKKAATASFSRSALDELGPDSLPVKPVEEEQDMLGRLPLRDTIERARSSGILNVSSRELQYIPMELFEIHLSVTPEPLTLVKVEPLPPPDLTARRRRGNTEVSWYDAQDLVVIHAGNNDILEVQHEISLFGSLKTIDLHNNKLSVIPPTIADLMALTTLDLSNNALTSLPTNLFALPNLTSLNLSRNGLTSLPFSAPFSNGSGDSFTSYTRASDSGSLFAPVIKRSQIPLPALVTLDASYNKLEVTAIDTASFPSNLQILNLSANPLAGNNFGGKPLLEAVTSLPKLRELRLANAVLHNDALAEIPPEAPFFPELKLLDVSETEITLNAITPYLIRCKKELQFEHTTADPPLGAIRVMVGRRVLRESWELEAERRPRGRAAAHSSSTDEFSRTDDKVINTSPKKPVKPIVKEMWELEADEGMSAGAKRRARAAAAATSSSSAEPPYLPSTQAPHQPSQAVQPSSESTPKTPTIREAWEIEAEQGLLTEGARRRARAAAAAAKEAAERDAPPPPSPVKSPAANGEGTEYIIMHSRYYSNGDPPTLTLPPSAASSRLAGGAHGRSWSAASPTADAASTDPHLALPTPTLPLAVIQSLPLADNLRVLILANRRLDQSFNLPSSVPEGGFLPRLEKLSLVGCRLGDNVPVTRGGGARTHEALVPLVAGLFPSVHTLDLSDNDLSSDAFTGETLAKLVLADGTSDPARGGLKKLILRSNKIDGLDAFAELALRHKGNRTVLEWRLEELDLGDNQISKLPFELGLMPLEVFLVDGNVFRIPQRRVWEREGTRGLLHWLRGRID